MGERPATPAPTRRGSSRRWPTPTWPCCADRDRLRLQLQSYAACGDPAIQAVVHEEWTRLYETVSSISGADEVRIHQWFAEGMLLNVAASIGDLDEAIRLKLALFAEDTGGPPTDEG